MKTPHIRTTFGRSNVLFPGRPNGSCTLPKSNQTCRFCSTLKNDGQGFKNPCGAAGAAQEASPSDMLGGQGADFLRGGCILEHQMFKFIKMSLHDRCNNSYDLASLFRGRHNTLDRWGGNIAKRIGASPSALIFEGNLAELFRFWRCQVQKWRKSSRILSFWSCELQFFEEISQNFFNLELSTCTFEGSVA